ncbi:unnamed protein product [Caenorhabditis bovis]|uniref:WAP domain-containing protein n=1 Tax=Caenorhabditis bovis TaxID=2654633 RepID=A0A8S1ET43_9PELO|nr:unnamed protein product [Caenorhabditis bovis]
MRLFVILFILFSASLIAVGEPGRASDFFSSFFGFGKKRPTTPSPRIIANSGRCSSNTNQCSAYECCNADQSCLRNRCFPRIPNCPVTRDQCGNQCCQRSEICKNGKCSR